MSASCTSLPSGYDIFLYSDQIYNHYVHNHFLLNLSALCPPLDVVMMASCIKTVLF